MTQFATILIYSLIAGLATLAGVYLVKFFREKVEKNILYFISFAIGVILASAFLNLLPAAAELNDRYFVWFFIGFGLLFLFEHILSIHSPYEKEHDLKTVGLTSTLGIGFHSLIDGIAIAVGFEISYKIGFLTSLAVIFHEVPEGVFTYTLLLLGSIPEKKRLFYSWLVTLATPVGALLTYFLIRNFSQANLGALLGLAGGTFIYIAASDLIPETHRRSSRFWLHLSPLLFGALFVIVILRYLE